MIPAEIEVWCIQDASQDAVDAFSTRVTYKYYPIKMKVVVDRYKAETVTCPYCHGSFVLTHYPKLTVRRSLEKGRKLFLASLIIAFLGSSLLWIAFPLKNTDLALVIILSLIAAVSMFFYWAHGVYVATRNAITVDDKSSVFIKGSGAPLRPTISTVRHKHQLVSGRGVHTSSMVFDLKDRLPY